MEIINNPELELQNLQYMVAEIDNTPVKDVVKNLFDGVYHWERTRMALMRIAQSKYIFSENELKILKRKQNTWCYWITPFASELVDMGYRFSVGELLIIDNPKNRGGNSVAHVMAENGHIFLIEELIRLGNPANHDGTTVAHIMASRGGYKFNDSEIKKLGNPKDKFNKTITDSMNFYEKQKELRYQPTHFTMIFHNGKPYFKEINGRLVVWVIIESISNYASQNEMTNTFKIWLKQTETDWIPELSVLQDGDKFNYLYQKIAMLELIKNLKECIQNQQELGFSQFVN